MPLHRLILALALVALAAGLAACGSEREDTATQADNEGIYLEVGGLTYQVQISRQLNPRDIEDQPYFRGLPAGTPPLKPNESWFGIFMRVANEGEEPVRSAQDFRVTDTQYQEGQECVATNGCYRAVPLDGRSNPFAYSSTQVDPGELYPPLSSAAQQSVTNGTLVLFRIPYGSYENRPLELHVRGAEVPQQSGIIEIDL